MCSMEALAVNAADFPLERLVGGVSVRMLPVPKCGALWAPSYLASELCACLLACCSCLLRATYCTYPGTDGTGFTCFLGNAVQCAATPWLLPPRTPALSYNNISDEDELLALRAQPFGKHKRTISIFLFSKALAGLAQNYGG